jgi:hypothetical protein
MTTLTRPIQTGWAFRAMAAALAAAIANLGLYLAGVAAGAFAALTLVPAGPQAEMAGGPILLVSMAGAAAGVGLYAALRRRVRRPLTVFGWIAGVVLLLSFAAPFAIPGWTRPQILLLETMHVVVAAAVWLVVHRGEREAA